VKTFITGLIWIEAFAFLFAALLHTGISIPFLPGFFHDPQIIGATVVEGACGVFLGFAALRVGSQHRAARATAIGAQTFSIAADIFGMIVIAIGLGPDSPFNYLFHRVGITILAVVLVRLFMRPARNVFAFRDPAPDAGQC
jgi:hypothetical protein